MEAPPKIGVSRRSSLFLLRVSLSILVLLSMDDGIHHVRGQQQPGFISTTPRECEALAQCNVRAQIFDRLEAVDTQLFGNQNSAESNIQQALQTLLEIAETHCKRPGDALDCRPGCARVFYRLAEIYRHSVGAPNRAHNLYQLAMSMFWDMSRYSSPHTMECLETGSVWNLDFNAFMDAYLSLAFELKRHTPEGLPPASTFSAQSYRKRKIAITSVCAYKESHMLHELYGLIKQNRDRYTKLHGYDSHLWNETYDPERAPVWAAIGLPLSLVQNNAYPEYEWILAADCDMMFVNMDVPVEQILDEYVNEDLDPSAKDVHVLITEDGRGLAGGIFMIRNSPQGRAIISSVYGDKNTVYDRHDLKDQWSFLWHFVRPKATELKPLELSAPARSWPVYEYADNVRLVPQRYLNAYPWASCRPSHHCFEDGKDLVISFITLSSFSKEMAYAMLNKFLHQSLQSWKRITGREEL